MPSSVPRSAGGTHLGHLVVVTDAERGGRIGVQTLQVAGAHRETVRNREVIGRKVAVGDDVLAHCRAPRIQQVHAEGRERLDHGKQVVALCRKGAAATLVGGWRIGQHRLRDDLLLLDHGLRGRCATFEQAHGSYDRGMVRHDPADPAARYKIRAEANRVRQSRPEAQRLADDLKAE